MESLQNLSRREIYQQLCVDTPSYLRPFQVRSYDAHFDQTTFIRTIANCKTWKEASSLLDQIIQDYLKEEDRKREEASDELKWKEEEAREREREEQDDSMKEWNWSTKEEEEEYWDI